VNRTGSSRTDRPQMCRRRQAQSFWRRRYCARRRVRAGVGRQERATKTRPSLKAPSAWMRSISRRDAAPTFAAGSHHR